MPPVFARVVEASEDCRAVALAKADIFSACSILARATTRQASMKQFFYVYILQSEVNPQRFYTGLTDDLRTRLKKHNSGRIVHTVQMEAVAIENRTLRLSGRIRAARLELYLKSASGRAFVKRHL